MSPIELVTLYLVGSVVFNVCCVFTIRSLQKDLRHVERFNVTLLKDMMNERKSN